LANVHTIMKKSRGRYPSHIVASRFGGSECGCHSPQYRARVEAFLPGTVSTVVRIEYRASAGRAPNTPIPKNVIHLPRLAGLRGVDV
jgi:hypothetical protein